MQRFFYFILFSLVLSSCNTTDQNGYVYDSSFGGPVPLKVEKEPSKTTSSGKCLADTLSFLVGQPETALAAMEYPADTRVLSESQGIIVDENYSSRLNLVIGADRRIVNIFCG